MKKNNNLFSIKNKIIVVTGAALGNGKIISESLINGGAKLILVDKKNIHKNLRKDQIFFKCDLTKSKNIINLVKKIKRRFNRIDVIINNAGISFTYKRLDYPIKKWNDVINVNLRAPFILSTRLVELMKKKGGSIINITSLSAQLGFKDNVAYVASKGGLKLMSKALANDFAKLKIRVNNIGPGYIKTNMTLKSWKNKRLHKLRQNKTLLNRWGSPQDLVGTIIFLSSDASSYITGQDIYVDGGWLAKGI